MTTHIVYWHSYYLANQVPTISVQSGLEDVNGQKYLYLNLSEARSINVLGDDDGTYSYNISSNSPTFVTIRNETDNSATITVNVDSTEPKNLRYFCFLD